MDTNIFELEVGTKFKAEHFLKNFKGKCGSPHKHEWEVVACFSNFDKIEPNSGVLIDFLKIEIDLKVLAERLAPNINNHPDFLETSPSAENLAMWFARELTQSLNLVGYTCAVYGQFLKWVKVYEEPQFCAKYNFRRDK